jgi:hypothetical protein
VAVDLSNENDNVRPANHVSEPVTSICHLAVVKEKLSPELRDYPAVSRQHSLKTANDGNPQAAKGTLAAKHAIVQAKLPTRGRTCIFRAGTLFRQ